MRNCLLVMACFLTRSHNSFVTIKVELVKYNDCIVCILWIIYEAIMKHEDYLCLHCQKFIPIPLNVCDHPSGQSTYAIPFWPPTQSSSVESI